MTLSIELQSEVRNISSETVRWPPLFAVDKWFHPGRESKLISMRTTVNGVTSSDMTIRSDDPFAVGGWLPELSRKPGDRVKFVAEAEEIRRVSDAYYLNLTRATPKPQVSVRVPEGIEYRVMFGNREQAQVQAVGAHTEALPGTLLPGQVIQVRWWPKSGGDA